jgi:tetraacyldisaccharide 4'-kinase
MNPLSALFGTIVGARNHLYERKGLRVYRLHGPVVSIGNISVGGSGKTPFLITLGDLLKQRGVPFDVLSRGYGRATTGIAQVDPAGSPREFGDEPLLIARKLRVPVIVGEDRYAAGRFAEQAFGSQIHLLDDGFQHRRLGRDFDIVLISSSDAKDSLLPAGRLREPLSSLDRANAIVFTNDDAPQGLPPSAKLVWKVQRSIDVPPIEGPQIAFCGIARPRYFFEQLRAAGVTLAATRPYRDHHYYTENNLRELLRLRQQHGAAGFVTTEKDIVNLGARATELAPLHIIPVRVEIEDAEAAVSALLATIEARKQQPA